MFNSLAKAATQCSSYRLDPFLCLLCTLLITVLSNTVVAERLPVKTYTVADGLLRDNVQKIKQDSRGFLWFCTAEGLSRFDGYEFKNFTSSDGLPDRHVNDFLETRNGDIWIATDGGLAKLNPTGNAGAQDDPLFTVLTPDDPSAKGIQILFEDENIIWVGTNAGLYKIEESRLNFVDLGDAGGDSRPLAVSSIIKDRLGSIWLGTAGGIFRLSSGGGIDHFDKQNGLPSLNVSVLYEDQMGLIWAGFRAGTDAGLISLVDAPTTGKNVVEHHYTEKEGLPADWVMDLRETSDGKFWVATTGGLCEWQKNGPTACKTFTIKNDLCDRDIWSITEDKDRNMWMGTRCGAEKWARYGFTSYAEADGTGYPLANSIFEDPAGDLFATFNSGRARTVSRFDGEKFELVKPSFPPGLNYFGWGWKQTVLHDSSSRWWFPTGDGLFQFPKDARFEDLSHLTPERIEMGAKGNEIFRTYEDRRYDIWVATTGTANELWRWDRTSDVWVDVTRETGIGASRLATVFVEDQSGNLWIGTGSDQNNAAIIRYRDGKFTVFSAIDNEMIAGWLRDLLVDREGRLWIASTGSGLLRLDNVDADQLTFTRYTPAQGISSSAIMCLTDDAFGRIYIGTGRGLDRLTPDTGQVENFTTADGLPNSYVDVAFRDRNNTLWFATGNGLARLNPEPQRQREPPKIFVTGLRIGGEPLAISILGESSRPELELAADQRQITVDFLGLGTSLGEKLKYEYRLNDSPWTATPARTVNFANLESANYRFEVRAITADRIYSEPATLVFSIASPVWQRPWFLAGMLIVAALLGYGIYKYRVGQLLELERIRTRIATDLHDDIGSNLTRIALLSEVANQQAISSAENGKPAMLSSIAEIARESVASMNDIVWAISPEHDSLLDLTRRMRSHADEVFTLRDIDLDFLAPTADTDLELSVGVRRDLLLIFKEAVNNAAKHSLCTEVVIEFCRRDSALRLTIKDNGKGFEFDPENGGYGLASMQRRAAALYGNISINSKKGAGTLVELEMPLPGSRQKRFTRSPE